MTLLRYILSFFKKQSHHEPMEFNEPRRVTIIHWGNVYGEDNG